MTQEKKILSFVRRKGKKLSKAKLDLINDLLPNIEIKDLCTSEILTKLIKQKEAKINLEIGYGNGEHLAMQGRLRPEELFIGCEPYLKGTVNLLSQIKTNNLENIYIYQDDAIELLNKLPNNFLNKIYILFPDPWPKTKHQKRRIINNYNLKIIGDKLKPNGLLRIATDHSEYASWIIAKMINQPVFTWEIKNINDWHKEPCDWTQTKYQEKALAGKKYYFFNFTKLG
ncbi:MAG: tRNA (guanosine(46)-N7)-methyltransferase TrmB [Alphaproteobacteria bacterium]|nr:tRNA (guanosine(46)-N7)-methyltransferase TrmB [Alphaproteobacteria bacterium]MBT5827448.1 tRNA (guanosine(46)-N7)-methyltransferase TrmB [Alphaproteobacteria bacterium]